MGATKHLQARRPQLSQTERLPTGEGRERDRGALAGRRWGPGSGLNAHGPDGSRTPRCDRRGVPYTPDVHADLSKLLIKPELPGPDYDLTLGETT